MMHTLDKSIYMLLLLTKCLSVFPTHIYETIHSKVRHIHKFRSPSGAHSQVAYLLQSHHLQLSLKQFQMLLPLLHRFHMFLLIYHAKVMMSTIFYFIISFHFVKLSSITKKNIFITFFSFFALILISLTFQFLGIIADYKANQVKLNYPYNIQQKLFCLLTFAFTAGFEEIVFRYILPESMQHIIKSKNNEKYKIIS